jgi:hypothetical protein
MRLSDLPLVMVDAGDRALDPVLAKIKLEQTNPTPDVVERRRRLAQPLQHGAIDGIVAQLASCVRTEEMGVEVAGDPALDFRRHERCSMMSMSSGRLKGLGRIAETPICRIAWGSTRRCADTTMIFTCPRCPVS